MAKHLTFCGFASAFLLLLAMGLPSFAVDAPDMVVLHESKPLVTRTGAWQSWGDHIHIKAGQEKLPLIFELTNGAEGRPQATDLKVTLDGKPFLAQGDKLYTKGMPIAICNLNGKLRVGSTPIVVQGFGPSGAWIKWKVKIQRPVINSVTPLSVGPNDSVTIKGSGFSDHPERLRVHVGKKDARPMSSSENELKFKLPHHVSSGNQQLTVSLYTVHSAPFPVAIKGAPRITWIDMVASPPEHPVGITGSGFSPVVSENVVMVGNHKAKVTFASDSHINFIIPTMHFPDWHVPIKVITNGVASTDKASINIDVRVIINEGIPMH